MHRSPPRPTGLGGPIFAYRHQRMPTDPCVLVVDDDERIRRMLAAALRFGAIRCEFAEDGDEALEKVEMNDYTVMLLDLMMPRLNGVEVIRKLRDSGNEIPIVVMTAAGPDLIRQIGAGTVEKILEKPFLFSEVVTAVSAFCQQNEAAN
jgi:DNA-binding response OmpR family regulator